MKRILMYSHDTVGLGNIRRTLKIANSLVDQDGENSVLILTGSPMLHAYRIKPRIDYVKLPCLDRSTADGYKVKSLGVEFKDVIRLRANLILNTIIDYDPDLILVDKKPLGVNRELAPAFEFLKLQQKRAKLVLILRDILDHPVQTKRVWQKLHYYEAIDTFYDQVLILGKPDIFNLPEEYGFPKEIRSKVKFVGYLKSTSIPDNSQSIRLALGIKDQLPIILVTAGSGSDGCHLINTYLKGLINHSSDVNFHSLVLSGPEMNDIDRIKTELLSKQAPNCLFYEFSNDLISQMNAASLVVSMGGYNSICEILSLNKPAIVVPRCHPVQEQLIRAQRMSQLGLFAMIHPDELSPESIYSCVREQLSISVNGVSRFPKINLDGLSQILKSVSVFHPQTDIRCDMKAAQFLMG